MVRHSPRGADVEGAEDGCIEGGLQIRDTHYSAGARRHVRRHSAGEDWLAETEKPEGCGECRLPALTGAPASYTLSCSPEYPIKPITSRTMA